jgi:tetratricopeptide (TPR) repeat protein
VALVFAIRMQPLFRHELSERLLKSLPSPSQASLSLLLFLLPLAAGLGLCWAAIAVFLVCAPYMTRRERVAVSLLLAVLGILPFGYEWVATRHILASSQQFALVQAVERGGRGEGLVQDLRGWAEKAPRDGLPHYYLGLVLKRRGELDQAEAEMAKASQLLPGVGFVQVGLGNVQYLLGRLPEAEATYRRAAEILPASASVQLNLSKLYTQRLQLDQSNEAVSRSLSLDPLMARTVSLFHGQGFTQFVIDEPVPWDPLAADLAQGRGGMRAVTEGLWGSPLRGVSLQLLPYAVGAVLILFWTHVMLRGGTRPVRRCQQCGTPFCGRCQSNPKEKVYCGPCAAVFRRREGVTAFVRGRRLREGEEWLRRERVRLGILGSVIPGGSDLYRGRIVRGILLCVPAVWLVAEGFALDHLMPSFRFASPVPGPMRYTATIVLLGTLYLYSLHRSWRRPISEAR